ncbi:hypothetical protein [Spirosoma sp.]|uniref:hypothetical protein n=1 Tax=Spirosoma sp. TaxID=1899569 RepID=UPI0026347045|nr:hypothetical protein [Spirosoma sp.]MCX6213519.1 hypothetical protein [Spirosoma sp.]
MCQPEHAERTKTLTSGTFGLSAGTQKWKPGIAHEGRSTCRMKPENGSPKDRLSGRASCRRKVGKHAFFYTCLEHPTP